MSRYARSARERFTVLERLAARPPAVPSLSLDARIAREPRSVLLIRSLLRLGDRAGLLPLLERLLGSGDIIAYRGISDDTFLPEVHMRPSQLREQLEFVASRYTPISLRELLQRRAAGKSTNRCVAVTFDDAYSSVASLAVPLLEHFGVPATLFVVTQFSRTGVPYWWDRIAWARLHAPAPLRECVVRSLALSPDEAENADAVRHAVLARAGRIGRPTLEALARVEAECEPLPLRPCTPARDSFALPRIGIAGVHSVASLRLRLARATVPVLVCRDGVHPRVPKPAGTGR